MTERFPKPAVPWFSDLHAWYGWDRYSTQLPRSATHVDGWHVEIVRQIDEPVCAQRSPLPNGYCGLTPGHDGPHFAIERGPHPARVASLRRVTPAERAS